MQPNLVRPAVDSVAGAYLALLADRGIEYLFGNAGTDFAPIVEAMAQAQTSGMPMPQPITAVHEHLAISMRGYVTTPGRIGTVMVHVSVGTADGVCATTNAARENVPLLFTAGRTPILEEGLPGHRTSVIHWGQEMFDPVGRVRECVKWDYELRSAEQVETIVDRALAAAQSEPQGPVYLSLPRKVLAAPVPSLGYTSPVRRVAATPAGPDSVAVDRLAQRLEAATHPVLITSNLGRDETAVAMLAAFAQTCAVPVVQCRARFLNLPHDHPMHGGYEPATFLEQADLVIVLDSDVPSVPASIRMRDDCYVVHAGHDPLFLRYPVRGFRCDAALTTGAGPLLDALTMHLAARIDVALLDARLPRMSALRSQPVGERAARLDAVRTLSPMHPAWVSHCLSHALDDEAIVVSEYPFSTEYCGFPRSGSFFASSTASGLGSGFGVALGAKLAHRERLVVATLGDGAYMFSNPSAGHHAAGQNDLPILVVVFNNAMWNAVRRATRGMCSNGHAVRSDAPAYMNLDGLPAFEDVGIAGGGHGERVEHPEALPAALARAIGVVTRERRQALIDVMCCVSDRVALVRSCSGVASCVVLAQAAGPRDDFEMMKIGVVCTLRSQALSSQARLRAEARRVRAAETRMTRCSSIR